MLSKCIKRCIKNKLVNKCNKNAISALNNMCCRKSQPLDFTFYTILKDFDH